MQLEEVVPCVKRIQGVQNVGGLRLASSQVFKGDFVDRTRLLVGYVKDYPLAFIPDYASLIGRRYSELKRTKSRRDAMKLLEELIRSVVEHYGDFRLIELLDKLYRERNISYEVAELVDVISQGMPFNVWLGRELCLKLGGYCIVEPTIIDIEPAISFDIALLTSGKPIAYIEVKRTLRKRLRRWIAEEALSFLGKVIRIMGSLGALLMNVQRLMFALVMFTHVVPSHSVKKFCDEKTIELSRGLKDAVVSRIVLWAGSYREIDDLSSKLFGDFP